MTIRIERDGRGYVLETEQRLPHPREAVFPFFAAAANLEAITPPQLRFRILTPQPITMAMGLLIDYRLRINGLPVRWTSEISTWEPPFRFVDQQRRGPYRRWYHVHEFVDEGDSTLVTDRVEYEVPGGRLAHDWLVRRQLMRIFTYRRSAIEAAFVNVGTPALATA